MLNHNRRVINFLYPPSVSFFPQKPVPAESDGIARTEHPQFYRQILPDRKRLGIIHIIAPFMFKDVQCPDKPGKNAFGAGIPAIHQDPIGARVVFFP